LNMPTISDLPQSRRTSAALLALTLAVLLPGCRSLPNISSFAAATGSLRSAVASGGSVTVAELARVEISGVAAAATNLANAWTERERLFTALSAYANSLQAIVDSGQSGAASAKALADAVTQLATTANIIQPGAGEATSVVTQTAMFVYEWIAKARAAASLEKALKAAQPAVERVAQVIGADMKDLDALVRLACKAQAGTLMQENATGLGYRDQLIKRRDELMNRMNSSLAGGRTAVELTETNQLTRVDELLAGTDSWYEPLQAQLKEITTREKLARQLVAETQVALGDWAAAHGQLLAAVRSKRPPSIAELSEAAQRIRELVEKFRNL